MASLKALYQSYLSSPSEHMLSDNASLNYITTLTTINTAPSIVKHHTAHQKVLKKKEEKILSCIEGDNALSLDIETTLEFLTGGGAYLPGLDDNFLADRTVTFPMIHIVHFDESQKITQVRLYWDQGSLLKLVDVIGARARNWPIRDGKDQARLIASSANATDVAQSSVSSRPSTASSAATESTRNGASMMGKPRSQSKNVTRDPHASLSLFAPREEDEEESHFAAPRAPKAQTAKPPPRDYHDLFVGEDAEVASETNRPRTASPSKDNGRAPKDQSAKPPPRDYHDLFVGNESDVSPVSKARVASPKKENMTPGSIAPKGGAGKNYKPSRLFDTEEAQPAIQSSPLKSYNAHPNRNNHFEFGDNDAGSQPVPMRPKSKHQNNWDFEESMTPEKAPTKPRGQAVRHFGWDDDEQNVDSPAKHPAVAKARPDANANFEFQDDGTPAGGRRPQGNPRGMGNVKSSNLYQNNVFDEDAPPSPEKKNFPLAPITNLKDRRKDFDPHFTMTDDSPTSNHVKQAPIPEARAKVVSQMGSQWEVTDDSPGPHSRSKDNTDRINPVGGDKENMQNGGGSNRNVGIKSGGDGMGGKKGAGRSWGFGDDSDEGEGREKFRAGKAQQAPKDNSFWDF